MKSLLPDRRHRRQLAFLALVSALSVAGYLLASRLVYRIGFPLDDAWIHHTYARNLALRGEWAFLPGQPSAGSTAPLWSALLAVGHLLHLGPYLWSYALGWATLLAVALVGMYAFRLLCPQMASADLWVGLFLVLEWHLVWAAVSGMETLLMGLLALIVLARLVGGERNWIALGALIGVSVWIRPDGITLIGPALFTLALASGSWKRRTKEAVGLLFGMALLVFPYLLFNRILEGSWWPNTLFAKQAEYAIFRQAALWRRFLTEASLPMIGAGVLLLPGFITQSARAVRSRSWGTLAGAIWVIGYLLLYALRLPVTYQHGRYVMPMMPAFFSWGLAGLIGWVQLRSSSNWKRLLSRVWVLSISLVVILFWGFGARAYAFDVAIIETEMVAAAHWVADNTASDALIAAHDIGALGYFAQRNLLDLAGLVSPEVIPFIRDEPRLAEFLQERQADYLVTFPAWYPQLVHRADQIYSTAGRFSPRMGGENMSVYRWMFP
ncbi:MAG: hypothetical protein A2W35_14515 [Chloroflexi bacterium RBG_16_57_11]|nr:MAG: hypothetical protein A2W35_14515 [Chloroflexi bacterium RBG_16_57_11]